MKLQRYNPCNNPRKYRAGCGPNAYKCNDGDYVLYSDSQARIEALEAENAALHAECDRLTAMLGPQEVLTAEEVTEKGLYYRRYVSEQGEATDWNICEVVGTGFQGDLGLRMYMIADEMDEELYGQFIGPIKMPEVQG